jgi:hypothetical protein
MNFLKFYIFVCITFLLNGATTAQFDESRLKYLSDVRGENIFVEKIHPSLPNFKFVVIADSSDNLIYRINILQNSTLDTIQVINIYDIGESPYRGAQYFRLQDLNFDKFKDLMVLNYWGVSGNEFYQVFLYDQSNKLFIYNDFLSNLCSPAVVDSTLELSSFAKEGFDSYVHEIYKFEEQDYILVKKVIRRFDLDLEVPIEQISVRKNNEMVIIKDGPVDKE